MTREEAIKFAEHAVNMTDIPEVKEFYRLAASALRPVSRERVEQMRGKFLIIRDVTVGERGELLFDAPSCSRCGHTITDICNFCPSCGAPMTDEAVEITLRRLEALHGE